MRKRLDGSIQEGSFRVEATSHGRTLGLVTNRLCQGLKTLGPGPEPVAFFLLLNSMKLDLLLRAWAAPFSSHTSTATAACTDEPHTASSDAAHRHPANHIAGRVKANLVVGSKETRRLGHVASARGRSFTGSWGATDMSNSKSEDL